MSQIMKTLARLDGKSTAPSPGFKAGSPATLTSAPARSRPWLLLSLAGVAAAALWIAGPFRNSTRVPASLANAAPDDSELFQRNRAAVASFYQGDLASSEVELRSLVVKRPGEASLRANLGSVLRKEGKEAEARAAFGEALRLDPQNALALNGMGQIYLQAGELGEAEVSFSRSLANAPQRTDTLLHLGQTAELEGQWATASLHYLRYLRTAPADDRFRPALTRRLAQLRHRSDEPRKGQE